MCGVIKHTAHVSLMNICNRDEYLMETRALWSRLWKTLEDVLEDVLGDNAFTMEYAILERAWASKQYMGKAGRRSGRCCIFDNECWKT